MNELEKRIAELESIVAALTETIAIHTKIIDTLQREAIQRLAKQ